MRKIRVSNNHDEMLNKQVIREPIEFSRESSSRYLKLMKKIGVPRINVRAFPPDSKSVFTKIIPCSERGVIELNKWVNENKLTNSTIFSTMHQFSDEKTTGNVKDADVIRYSSLFIDVDSVKYTESKSPCSATDEEKNGAEQVYKAVIQFLKQSGFNEPIIIDSGNGYHLIYPIENADVKDIRELHKQFLIILDSMFSTKQAKIDLKVFNPGRLGKLVGSPATKGDGKEPRPYRMSKFVSIPDDFLKLSVSVLRNFVEKHAVEMQNSSEQSLSNSKISEKKSGDKSSKIWKKLFVDVATWLNYYDLKCQKNPGETEGFFIYVFDSCPMRDHSNNHNGASLIVNSKKNLIKFNCHHESDSAITIDDFVKRYPIPKESFTELSDLSLITVEDLLQGKAYRSGKFRLTNNELSEIEEDSEIKIGNPIFISDTRQNQDTLLVEYLFRFQVNTNWLSKWMPADLLQVSKIRHLTQFGYVFHPKKETAVIEFLSKQKELLSMAYVYESIGWVDSTFRLARTYSDGQYAHLAENGYFDLSQKGTFEEFKQFFESEIKGSHMELVLCLGVATIVHGYLKIVEKYPLDNLLINLQGKSSTGKSTALSFIASLYGPVEGVLKSFNATGNAIFGLANKIQGGLPLLLDEMGASTAKDNSALLYQLASGSEKLRMNKSLNLRETNRFTSLIFVSSEERLASRLQELDGLKVRHLEFSNIQWTKSATHSTKMKQFITNHYGVLIDHLIQKIIENDLNQMKELYVQAMTDISPKLVDNPLKDRIAANLALIMTSSRLLRIIGLEINEEVLEQQLIDEYEYILTDQMTSLDYYDSVKELLVMNSHKFVNKTTAGRRRTNVIWGKFAILSNNVVKVNVFKAEFEKQLRLLFKVTDVSLIIRDLMDNKRLNTEKGRRTKRVQINKQSVTSYEIILDATCAIYFNLGNSDDDGPLLFNPGNFPDKSLELFNKDSNLNSNLNNDDFEEMD